MARLSSELHLLRDMLMHKFGREFSLAVMENRDECVPTRVRNASIRGQTKGADALRKGHQQARYSSSPLGIG